jgi:hypothetical protein
MWPRLVNAFPGWQSVFWLALAAIPPLIILLYFLKLKRRPVEVPSTYLWHKSIEDLHVNTIWQRLRRNLLLFLQLLLLLLVVLALLQPHWRGRQLTGDRFIFLVDNSASMQAGDVAPSRLEEAKRRTGELIDAMKPGDAAMLISFSDTARVEQPFTRDRRLLRRALEGIGPSDRPTSLHEALRVASGLANPGRTSDPESLIDFQVAEPLPAELYILSDGRFAPVVGFSLGNLRPTFVPIGSPEARNVAVAAFSVRRKEGQYDQLEAFARLENFGPAEAAVGLELWLDDRLLDADRLTIPADGSQGVVFDLGAVKSGLLRLAAATGDDLRVDDEAWVVIREPRPARILLVTPGNEPLEFGLSTRSIARLADVVTEPPAFLGSDRYRALLAGGAFDLVIFDRCRPEQMPPANTLFIGSLPPEGGWAARPTVALPQVIDVDAAHPLMLWLDLSDVDILDAAPLELPPGAAVLVDSGQGPLAAVAPRERFEDAVLAFVLVDETVGDDGKTERVIGTNWPIRASFPVFILNVVEYLGEGRKLLDAAATRPGQPASLESPAPGARLSVRTPSGKTVEVEADNLGKIGFTETGEVGVYEVRSGGKVIDRFAVNLFDAQESRIAPEDGEADWGIQIGYVEVAGQTGWTPARRDIWKILLGLGLLVLLLEWYIYNRRVSM